MGWYADQIGLADPLPSLSPVLASLRPKLHAVRILEQLKQAPQSALSDHHAACGGLPSWTAHVAPAPAGLGYMQCRSQMG